MSPKINSIPTIGAMPLSIATAEKSKSAFLEGTQARTNLYASGTCGIEYYEDSSRYFFVRNNSFQAFSSDKDFSELLFFGNGVFRGQKVTTNGLNYMQANTLSTGLGFDIFKIFE